MSSTTTKASPLLDINWKSLVSGGIKSVAASAASWGLSWALNSVFGIQTEEQKKKQEKQQLIDTLTSVQSELTSMATTLSALDMEVSALGKQMDVDTQAVINAIMQSPTAGPVADIQTHWGQLGKMVNTSLAAATDAAASTDSPTASQTVTTTEQTLAFAQNVMGNWDIPTALTTIGNAFLPSKASTGLLSGWTNLLILKMIDNAQAGQSAQVSTAYLTLEQNFLAALQTLYQGFGLVLNATMRLTLNQNSQDPNVQSIIEQAGTNYLASASVSGLLTKLTEQFLFCAHQIVLSQYMVPKGQTFVPFTSQADADFVIGRATLVSWLINSNGAAQDPGLRVARYLRPSQTTTSTSQGKTTYAAPSLTPADYAASNGDILNTKTANASWYKVVDFEDDDCTIIREIAASDIVVASYEWTSPTPTAGANIAIPGIAAGITPQYYSTTTLTTKDANGNPVAVGEGAVLFGFVIDMSGITDNPFWTSTWSVSSTSPSGKDSQYVTWAAGCTNALSNPGAARSVNVTTFTITGQYKGKGTGMSFVLSHPLSYAGASGPNASLNICVDGSIAIFGYDSNTNSGGAVPFTISGTAQVGSVNLGACNVTTPGASGGITWTYEQANANANLDQIVTMNTSRNPNLNCSFEMQLQAFEQSALKDYNNAWGIGSGKGGLTLNMVTLAWPQPVPSPSST